MLWYCGILVLISASCFIPTGAEKVCYSLVGCFTNDPPFNNTKFLPETPSQCPTTFYLHTRQNRLEGDILDLENTASLTGSHFDVSKPVKVIIHGWRSSVKPDRGSVYTMKNELLTKGDFNVISVDWKVGASRVNYFQSVANLRLVAAQTILLLKQLVQQGLSLDKVHLIGHSLGAHAAGLVGHALPSKIQRITGLDPAEPSFKGEATVVRLDPSDAAFVDVIHSDGGNFDLKSGFGLITPMGHVDYYPNGGIQMPGCGGKINSILDILSGLINKKKNPSCNHGRAVKYFTASVNSACTFKSVSCQSYEKFQKGECSCKNGNCGVLGYNADKSPARGRQYLNTLDEEPYCGSQYKVSVKLLESKAPKGRLFVTLEGESSVVSSAGVLDTQNAKTDSDSIQGMIIVDKEISLVKTIKAHFTPSEEGGKSTLAVESISVTRLGTEKSQYSLSGNYHVTGTDLDIAMEESVDPILG